MGVSLLKEALRARGLDHSGKKADLQERLLQAVNMVNEPSRKRERDDGPGEGVVAERSGQGTGQRKAAPCPLKQRACAFLATLEIDEEVYFDSEHDRCYCERCYLPTWPDTIVNEGPTPYVVPRGWYRFGLALPPRGKSKNLDIFNRWSVSFHGTKNPLVLSSVLNCGQLMKPGDKMLDGKVLHSTKCAGRQDKVFYTSPTVKYAGLKFYADRSYLARARRRRWCCSAASDRVRSRSKARP